MAIALRAAGARAEPTVPSGQRVSADVIVCGNPVDCALADAIAPAGWRHPQRQIVIDGIGKPGPDQPPPDVAIDVIASGEIGGNPLPDGTVASRRPRVAGAMAIVPIAIAVEDLPPDHYVGTIRLGGIAAPADVPLDLRVRRGPLWPLVWLLAGIVLGLLARFWSENGEKPARVVPHILPGLARVLVVILLVLFGLHTLYVQGGATFGAQPLHDHLALVLWGLGSEVTSRSLSNLGGLLGRVRATAASAEAPAPAQGQQTQLGEVSQPISEAGSVHLPEDDDIVPAVDTRDHTPWPRDHLDTQKLIDKHRTGQGVRVAIIDSGVDLDQSEIDRTRVEVLDIRDGRGGRDEHGHGTCMVALVASQLGVCPDAKIVSIRALDENGTGSADDLVAGIKLALSNSCDVISISAGQGTPHAGLAAAVTEAQDRGALVVAAVLNKSPHGVAFPASLSGCVGVTPTDPEDALLFGSAPAWVTCGAPGVQIPTWGRDGRKRITGSSPATALVAGTCAMLLQAKPRGPSRTLLAQGLAAAIRRHGIKTDGVRRFAPMAIDEEIEG